MGDSVDGHDEVVVEGSRVSRLDQCCDEIREDADVMCSAPQADEGPGRKAGQWERWLLFEDAALGLAFALAGTGRCDLARLHELADIPAGG